MVSMNNILNAQEAFAAIQLGKLFFADMQVMELYPVIRSS
jgi:hypothetical protein